MHMKAIGPCIVVPRRVARPGVLCGPTFRHQKAELVSVQRWKTRRRNFRRELPVAIVAAHSSTT